MLVNWAIMPILFLQFLKYECRPQIDYVDPYNYPEAENTLGYRYNPMATFTARGKEGTAITAGVHKVNADLDAILDIEDQIMHAPIHGTIIMPRLAAKMVNPWATSYMPQPRQLNPLFPQTIEDSYLPSQQFSDSLIVMVDDPVVLVGKKPS